ncbi:hypothetical protein PIB30_053190, partial [Stylosanthes scabra]|nr:hypothetical protein [Stylosanthes scabra]
MGDDQKMKKATMHHHHHGSTTRPSRTIELEELYQGIPDESVNLTFQDLANVQYHSNNKSSSSSEKRGNSIIAPTTTITNNTNPFVSPNSSPMAKLPSLDFSKGLQATNNKNHHHGGGDDSSSWGHFGHHHHGVEVGDHHRVVHNNNNHHDQFSHASEYSMGYDDSMMMSGVSTASGKGYGGRRRPGIPHSKICTVCSNYIYILRTRCLV